MLVEEGKRPEADAKPRFFALGARVEESHAEQHAPVAEGETHREHSAPRETDERRALHPELGEGVGEGVGVVVQSEERRDLALAVPRAVEHDRATDRGERAHLLLPLASVEEEAMQADDGDLLGGVAVLFVEPPTEARRDVGHREAETTRCPRGGRQKARDSEPFALTSTLAVS